MTLSFSLFFDDRLFLFFLVPSLPLNRVFNAPTFQGSAFEGFVNFLFLSFSFLQTSFLAFVINLDPKEEYVTFLLFPMDLHFECAPYLSGFHFCFSSEVLCQFV